MNQPIAVPVLIALDALDAQAWAVEYPELVPAMQVITLGNVASLAGGYVSSIIVTEHVSLHPTWPAVQSTLLRHVRFFHSGTALKESRRFVRELVDADVA